MTEKKCSVRAVVLLLFMVAWPSLVICAHAGAEDIGLTIEPEFSFDSGDYGGGDTITTTSFSITGEYDLSDAWTLSLTIVPWQIQNEVYTDVVLVSGRPVHHFDASGINPHHENTHSHAGRRDRHTGRSDSIQSGNEQRADGISEKNEKDFTASTSNKEEVKRAAPSSVDENILLPGKTGTLIEQEVKHRGSESGIGDTSIDLSYSLLKERGVIPEISLHGGLKIPTADEDKGLGTGKVDFLLGVDVSRDVGVWSLEVGVTYNILGDPAEYELNNYLSGYGEIGNALSENLGIAVQLSGAQAASNESDGELALGMQLRYDMEEIGEFSAGVQKGLADGSPDYSVVIGYSISF